MSHTERFYREVHAEALAAGKRLVAGQAPTGNDMIALGRAVRLVEEAANTTADRDRLDKARRERIDWIRAPGGVMVARVGRGLAHYWPPLRRVCIYRADGSKVAQFDANSTESATRKIRAWRKRK